MRGGWPAAIVAAASRNDRGTPFTACSTFGSRSANAAASDARFRAETVSTRAAPAATARARASCASVSEEELLVHVLHDQPVGDPVRPAPGRGRVDPADLADAREVEPDEVGIDGRRARAERIPVASPSAAHASRATRAARPPNGAARIPAAVARVGASRRVAARRAPARASRPAANRSRARTPRVCEPPGLGWNSTTASRASTALRTASVAGNHGSRVETRARRAPVPATESPVLRLVGDPSRTSVQRNPRGRRNHSLVPVVVLPLDTVHGHVERTELREALDTPSTCGGRRGRSGSCSSPWYAGMPERRTSAGKRPGRGGSVASRSKHQRWQTARSSASTPGTKNRACWPAPECRARTRTRSACPSAANHSRSDVTTRAAVTRLPVVPGAARYDAGAIGVRRLHRAIVRDAVRRRAVEDAGAAVEHQRAPRERRDRLHVVAHEQHRAPGVRDLLHLAEALALELAVADREHFVDDQDLRLEVRRDGEREPHVHAAAVVLHRRVEEALDLGERDDLVELRRDLARAACRGSRRSGRRSRGRSAPDGTRCRPRAARRRGRT